MYGAAHFALTGAFASSSISLDHLVLAALLLDASSAGTPSASTELWSICMARSTLSRSALRSPFSLIDLGELQARERRVLQQVLRALERRLGLVELLLRELRDAEPEPVLAVAAERHDLRRAPSRPSRARPCFISSWAKMRPRSDRPAPSFQCFSSPPSRSSRPMAMGRPCSSCTWTAGPLKPRSFQTSSICSATGPSTIFFSTGAPFGASGRSTSALPGTPFGNAGDGREDGGASLELDGGARAGCRGRTGRASPACSYGFADGCPRLPSTAAAGDASTHAGVKPTSAVSPARRLAVRICSWPARSTGARPVRAHGGTVLAGAAASVALVAAGCGRRRSRARRTARLRCRRSTAHGVSRRAPARRPRAPAASTPAPDAGRRRPRRPRP